MIQNNAREDVEKGLEEDADDADKTIARSKVLQTVGDPEVINMILEKME
jgi:hypothetical protein